MKTWLLGLVGSIIAAVVVAVVTDYLLPSLLPKAAHEMLHPQPEVPRLPTIVTNPPIPHRAPKSWCQGLKEQAEFRQQHWGTIPQSLRDEFNEKNCAGWGIQIQ